MAVIVSNSLVILMPSILNQVLVESKVLFCIENRTSTILSLANTKKIKPNFKLKLASFNISTGDL
ncbi:hypothetical protein MXE32_08950, partial [Streptococcus pyogenes]|uniref:hypothetical protein n=1 Tax=Streptococcus pyogenes TaxID=1314 RepID=UPI0022FEC703